MARQRDPLPRLNINVPPNLNAQQPRGQPLYSPALPTSLQQSFHPALQTPMQQNFFPQHPPPAPGRPTHTAAHPSIAQLAAVGIHPPTGFPITPLGGHFPRGSIALPPPLGHPHAHPGAGAGGPPSSAHPFPNRNRRQLSIGGPPKAVLGGPARKVSPIPPATEATPSAAPAPKVKKVIVNLPKETIPGEGQPSNRPEWARNPSKTPFEPQEDLPFVESSSAEEFPPESWRKGLPSTIDVFLPGKGAWEAIKQQAIEEKLEKLGVERGGSSVPQIQAPHTRAASISSPADPALLFFKLNKLQQAQLGSSHNGSPLSQSLSTSPQPPFNGLNPAAVPLPGFSPSPTGQHHVPRFITNRHGHSLSLAQPPSGPSLTHPQNSLLFRTPSAGATGNPFGPNAVLGSDQNGLRKSASPGLSVADSENSQPHTQTDTAMDEIHAPQGRAPVVMSSLVVPPSSTISRPNSKPDFTRGFGLDIPEEEEEEEEEYDHRDRDRVEAEQDEDEGDSQADEMTEEGTNVTAPHSRHHSRHESRLSAALSLRSFGGLIAEGLNERFGVNNEEGDRNRDGRTDLQIEVRPSDGMLQVPSTGHHIMGRRNTLGAPIPESLPIPAPAPEKSGHAANGSIHDGNSEKAGEAFEGVDEWTGSEDVYDHDQYESEDDNEVCTFVIFILFHLCHAMPSCFHASYVTSLRLRMAISAALFLLSTRRAATRFFKRMRFRVV
ncbi:hypothetical protein D9758_007367 [Tetrapyrgos nigripes]|uniref:Uncharacterized protein n=1 Tax=Tetrapyrgos nigripes TaxID=182062 RepID=A0A8H5GB18_9AGAR|nr:hypothetical protein D9758_007367 [Tetrapyrgos nigripes]